MRRVINSLVGRTSTDVLPAGHPALRAVCKPVSAQELRTPELKNIIEQMTGAPCGVIAVPL